MACWTLTLRRSAALTRSATASRVPMAARTGRLFSKNAGKTGFEGELATIYKIVAENHRHPKGPWVTMLDQVHAYANQPGSTKKLRILDLATGPGEPAETIARQFPDATVVATDLSPDQIAMAQEQTKTLPHMTCQVADMEHLEDFENDSFDLVTCCYGFMFPPNKEQAVAESFRVLKPGGQLIATTWNRLEIMNNLRIITTDVLGGKEPPAPPMNPLSLSEPGLFQGMLVAAGYMDISTTTLEYPFDLTNDPETQFKASVMLIKDQLDEINGWTKAREAFDKIKMNYAYSDSGHLILPGNEYQLTVATKPNK